MAQTGYTPISLYYSTTASAAPTAGNLVAGELALNTVDEKLYFKNSVGTVKLLASSSGAAGDVVGPASATDNAIVRFDGTTGKLVQNSVVTIADSTGDISGVGVLNATTLDATNVEVTNIKAKDGTASATIADSTGVMTIGSSVLTTTDINGGTIDGTAIGGTTPAAGAFITLSATGTITSTSSAIVLRNNAAGTTYKELDIGNTGNSVFLGVEGSPTQLLTGATAYDSFINTATGTGFVTAVNFVTVTRATSTGLAVTGSGTSTYSDGATYTLGILSGGASIARIGGTSGTTSLELMVNGSVISTHSLTGLSVTGTLSSTGLLTASAGLTSTYAKVTATYSGVQEANKGEFAFTTGNVEFYSYGPNAATPGGYAFITRSSNASVNVTPVTISSTGLAVTGNIANPWTNGSYIGWNFDADFYQRIINGATNREMVFSSSSSDTRADFVWQNSQTGSVNLAERMRLSTTGLAVTGDGTFTSADTSVSIISTGAGQTAALTIKGGSGGGDQYNYIQSLSSADAQYWYLGGDGVANQLTVKTGGSARGVFSSTGLAVTGGISGTTTLQLTGANSLAIGGVSGSYRLQRDSATFQFLNTADNIMLEVSAASISTGSATALSLATAGGTQAAFLNAASAVNYLTFSGSGAGADPYIQPAGSDTNIGLFIGSKGSDSVYLHTGGTSYFTQVAVTHTASANRYITLTGSNGGNPTIGTSAGSLAVSTGLAVTGALSATGDISAASVSGTAVATQADQETATSTTTIVTPGRQQFHPSAAKVWGQAGVTGNLIVGYNVTSITDVGTGIATVVVGTDFSTDNVPISDVVSALGTVFSKLNATPAIGSFSITASSATGTPTDPDRFLFCAFGDQ